MEITEEMKKKCSSMMQHYWHVKDQYPDCIIFYRLGDFYEMFFNDAEMAAPVLGLALTGRDCGLEERAPMCGVPMHAAEGYINKLIKNGFKVAICEQLTPVVKKGVPVERGIVRVITSGTITSDVILEENQNNYLVCIVKQKEEIGVAYTDITTGQFCTAEIKDNLLANLSNLLARINPAEIICNSACELVLDEIAKWLPNLPKYQTYYDWAFEIERSVENLKRQFGETCLSVYELNKYNTGINACGALLEYLNETQKMLLKQINKIERIENEQFMVLDFAARRNLEITETMRDRKRKGSLLGVLDNTQTAMGARMFKVWLEQPLKDATMINNRLDAVQELYSSLILRDNLTEELKKVKDIERIAAKIGMQTIMPKDCHNLKTSLQAIPYIKELLAQTQSKKLLSLNEKLSTLHEITDIIDKMIMENPAPHLKDGGYINDNYDDELDECRKYKSDGDSLILAMELRDREATGIKSLRIKFNNVYGYFYEVNKSFAAYIPDNFQKKQTVGNQDRYFTPELKEVEKKILHAEETAVMIELRIFYQLREKLIEALRSLQDIANILSELDCLLSLAKAAVRNNYNRPVINDKLKHIIIEEGRHPVVENVLKHNEFISNDTNLNDDNERVMIITGPNMAGKSTYMRQVAVITLMAHIGSFVPAKKAEIAITDRIFTRVGASDDLAAGQSTFMVEMTEMASILRNATDQSLIILDEIGRGTSTFDGLSIAWSVLEHYSKNTKSKVLFATHYHELTELEGILPGIKNYKINVKEINNSIVFLRKIVRGGASRSFGIEVASLAGIPQTIIKRAKEISHNIDEYNFNIKLASDELEKSEQLKEVNAYNNQIVGIIKDIDIENLTPIGAFEILQDLVQKVR